MNFEQIPKKTTEKEIPAENDIYKKARVWSDFFLKSYDFVKEEEIIEISPQKVKDETPIFFSPGWGIKETSKSIMEVLANTERKVISTFFSREESIINKKIKEDIPGAELQKAFAIIEIIRKKSNKRTDAIGHSEGGLALALAVSIRPDLFRNIVLIAPAGMMKNDSFWGLIGRFAIKEPYEEIKEGGLNMNIIGSYLKDITLHYLKNRSLSSKEIKAMTQMNVFEMTKYIKKQGIGVGLVCGTNDKVFPIEEVMKNIDNENVDYFRSTKGNHSSIILSDEYKEYVLLAEKLLTIMARKKNLLTRKK